MLHHGILGTAKLSDGKEVSITLVLKTKFDNSKAYKNGSFDKSMSKSVSLSMSEALILRTLMSSMDPKVSGLTSTCSQPLGRKRKHQRDDPSTAVEAMLAEFN